MRCVKIVATKTVNIRRRNDILINDYTVWKY